MEEKILELVDMYIVYPKEDVKTLINSSSRVRSYPGWNKFQNWNHGSRMV